MRAPTVTTLSGQVLAGYPSLHLATNYPAGMVSALMVPSTYIATGGSIPTSLITNVPYTTVPRADIVNAQLLIVLSSVPRAPKAKPIDKHLPGFL